MSKLDIGLIDEMIELLPTLNLDVCRYHGPRQGDCYMLAAKFVLDNEKWFLVHGTIVPPEGPLKGKIYFHAWCEYKNIIYEPTFNNFWAEQNFDSTFSPRTDHVYGIDDVRENILNTGHWGIWQKGEQRRCLKES